jgi:hypothetical protein
MGTEPDPLLWGAVGDFLRTLDFGPPANRVHVAGDLYRSPIKSLGLVVEFLVVEYEFLIIVKSII